jgi:RNA polymerase primary sigma factor
MPRARDAERRRNEPPRRRSEHDTHSPSAPERAERRGDRHAAGETTDSLQIFLNQAGRYPLLTREEEVELAQRIERGDLAAKDKLINSNLRLAIKFARRYEGHGMSLQDLVQEAMLGLIRAAEKFDWRRGYKFSTYAVLWIKQAMQRGLDNSGRTVRIPAHIAQRERSVNRVTTELNVELNREPTDEEVALRAKLPLDEVMAIRDLTRVTSSLDQPVGEGDTSLGELRAEAAASVEDEVTEREQEQAVSAALTALPEDERAVIELRFGTGREAEASLRDAARRLGVTQARVRELEARALRRLASDGLLAGWRAAA